MLAKDVFYEIMEYLAMYKAGDGLNIPRGLRARTEQSLSRGSATEAIISWLNPSPVANQLLPWKGRIHDD